MLLSVSQANELVEHTWASEATLANNSRSGRGPHERCFEVRSAAVGLANSQLGGHTASL